MEVKEIELARGGTIISGLMIELPDGAVAVRQRQNAKWVVFEAREINQIRYR